MEERTLAIIDKGRGAFAPIPFWGAFEKAAQRLFERGVIESEWCAQTGRMQYRRTKP